MAPRSLEHPHGDQHYYQEQEHHQQQQHPLYRQSQQQKQEEDLLPPPPPAIDFDAYYGANHSPPSPRAYRADKNNTALFKSRREMRHRRTDSRNRSLWHRASRRLVAAAAGAYHDHSPSSASSSSSAGTESTTPQQQQEQQQQAAPIRPHSRKHNSLFGAPEEENKQEQHSSFWPHQPEQQPSQTRRHQTWYYSSNHVLVNRERLAHGLPPMMRSVLLDDKARQVAQWAAEGRDLKDAITEQDAQTFVSGNVLVGGSIREIHGQTLIREQCQRERNNLLNPEYHEFGMGTYKDPQSGLLYMCQLFATGQQ